MSVNHDTFACMNLLIHTAGDARSLADTLAQEITSAELGPFDSELIITGGRAQNRFLEQHFTTVFKQRGSNSPAGISAGLQYLNPRRVVEAFLPSREDPWQVGRLSWHILNLLRESTEQWAKPLQEFIARDDGQHHYEGARTIASLFDEYATHRPSLLREWLAGSSPNDPDEQWQAELFRALHAHLGALPLPLHIPEAIDEIIAREITRFHVWVPELNPSDIEFLQHLPPQVEAQLWLVVPHAQEFRDALAAGKVGGESGWPRRFEKYKNMPITGPLGAAWWDLGATIGHMIPAATHAPALKIGSQTPQVPDSLPKNIQVHASHGPSRQVEVLREALTDLLQQNQDLHPRDILILSPSISDYAPLLQAAFNPGVGHPGGRIPIRVGGLKSQNVNPLLELGWVLTTLVGSRVTSNDIAALVERPEVAKRFRFSRQDAELFLTWIRESGIRWGLDASQRHEMGVPTEEHTIESGLHNLLLGAASELSLEGITPYTKTQSADLDSLGAFAEMLTRTRHGLTQLQQATSLGQWVEGIAALIDQVAQGTAEEHYDLHQQLGHINTSPDTPVKVQDMRFLMQELGQQRTTLAQYGTGAITAAGLAANAALPHKVVCLLGMDDASFPRSVKYHGDNLLHHTPLPGETSQVDWDRAAFLSAVTSATEHLILTYSAWGEIKGEERDPATPLIDLRKGFDKLDIPVVHTKHFLHPFDSRYFDGTLTSYDHRLAPTQHDPGSIDEATPEEQKHETKKIELRELEKFFDHPVEYFFTRCLRMYVNDEIEKLPQDIPITIDGLSGWQVGQSILNASEEAGWQLHIPEEIKLQENLPPGRFGQEAINEVSEKASTIVHEAAKLELGPVASVEIEASAGAHVVTGVVSGLSGDRLVFITYSTQRPTHLFRLWLRLVALAAHAPHQGLKGTLIARDRETARVLTWNAPSQSEAQEILKGFIHLFDAGTKQPIPLPVGTAYEWQKAKWQAEEDGKPASVDEQIRKADLVWSAYSDYQREKSNPYHELVWGVGAPIEKLFDQPNGTRPEQSLFAEYAAMMWEGMLNAV